MCRSGKNILEKTEFTLRQNDLSFCRRQRVKRYFDTLHKFLERVRSSKNFDHARKTTLMFFFRNYLSFRKSKTLFSFRQPGRFFI